MGPNLEGGRVIPTYLGAACAKAVTGQGGKPSPTGVFVDSAPLTFHWSVKSHRHMKRKDV